MIAPLLPFAIRGAIWYQGESNADRGYQYRTLFPAMITDWREQWGQGDFPFYFVQLANFMAANDEPADSQWAELREAQLFTLQLPNTGMAVIIDIGEAEDIHPKNKQDVGKRLALNALAQTYGAVAALFRPAASPPHAVEGAAIRVQFDHADGGLLCHGEQLTGFAIAGEDKQFVWADAAHRRRQRARLQPRRPRAGRRPLRLGGQPRLQPVQRRRPPRLPLPYRRVACPGSGDGFELATDT